ncbi:MAG: hypothetical protein IT581_21205, partial [Verrucomicrobiales bacterium]|nr:hypothetical protein [Verrucomicrobiales bacterium]
FVLDEKTGPWSVSGGRLRGGTIEVKAGGGLSLQSAATLESMKLRGMVQADQYETVRLTGGLDLAGGTLRIPGGRLEILDTQTIEGGTVELLGSGAWSYLAISAQKILTLSATTVLRGGPGWVQGEGTLRNLGTIRADVPGQTLRIRPAVFLNEGTVIAANGGILDMP